MHSTYGALDQFLTKDDSIRGDGGRGLLKVLYLSNAFVLLLASVAMIYLWELRTVLVGMQLGIIAIAAVVLEFFAPAIVMKHIPFYECNLGRGLVLCFLSSIALFGSTVLGLLSLTLSFISLGLHFAGFDVPLPLFEAVSEAQPTPEY